MYRSNPVGRDFCFSTAAVSLAPTSDETLIDLWSGSNPVDRDFVGTCGSTRQFLAELQRQVYIKAD
jgi:hypothetical protein